jgi:hypothetical protein
MRAELSRRDSIPFADRDGMQSRGPAAPGRELPTRAIRMHPHAGLWLTARVLVVLAAVHAIPDPRRSP